MSQQSESDNNELNSFLDDYYGITSGQQIINSLSYGETKSEYSFNFNNSESFSLSGNNQLKDSWSNTQQSKQNWNSNSQNQKTEDSFDENHENSSWISTPDIKRNFSDFNKDIDIMASTRCDFTSWSQPVFNSNNSEIDKNDSWSCTQPEKINW
ncbi:unnamed protein product [Brachionus calyciflorus]|uniref:Uncharacterized protein n=1 Tax=Brachionus calyciflorus TaxID=104777 RepID=A0A813TJE9_9BILA|nr:unnamed protein product [Brachionus calyciflorus]